MDAAAVTAITGAVDFATVVTGIGAIGAALVVLKVAMAGMRKLTSAIR
jgi:hypothetical protein